MKKGRWPAARAGGPDGPSPGGRVWRARVRCARQTNGTPSGCSARLALLALDLLDGRHRSRSHRRRQSMHMFFQYIPRIECMCRRRSQPAGPRLAGCALPLPASGARSSLHDVAEGSCPCTRDRTHTMGRPAPRLPGTGALPPCPGHLAMATPPHSRSWLVLAPDLGCAEVQLRRGAWLVRPDRCLATAPAALGLARAASYSTVPGQPPQQQPGLTMEMALSISNATFMQLDKGLQGGHLDQIRVRGHHAAPTARAKPFACCVCRRLALGRRWPAAGRRCSTCT
eukprot:COSAG04_NODE_2356_length_4279_cov_2.681818_2_plen_284_part_00